MIKLVIAGVGPGNPNLITNAALVEAENADLVIMPRSHEGKKGIAEKIILHHLPHLKFTPVLFPMIQNEKKRDDIIKLQIENLRPEWIYADKIFFPVVGDSALYATGAYLYNIWRELMPDLQLELIPGVSAHSLAASCAKRFLALSDEILTIIPGTAEQKRVKNALISADAVAIYKPTAFRNNLPSLINSTGEWREIIRVDHAGFPDEKIFTGKSALENVHEYFSILLLLK